jgi:hypothetical protein
LPNPMTTKHVFFVIFNSSTVKSTKEARETERASLS